MNTNLKRDRTRKRKIKRVFDAAMRVHENMLSRAISGTPSFATAQADFRQLRRACHAARTTRKF